MKPFLAIYISISATQLPNALSWSLNAAALNKDRLNIIGELGMASRARQKKASRSKWAEARGFGSTTATPTVMEDDFCTIVGGGRIGSLLGQGEKESSTLLLGRGDSIPSDGVGPVIVCTRNEALEGIIENCPDNRRKDLVFVQNGYLDDFLDQKGLKDNTQALLYVSVTAKGAEPIDGVTDVNPEGLTAVTGLHSSAFAKRLNDLGLKCRVLSPEEYRPAMFEKLIWISTYMLVGVAKDCASVGEAALNHGDLVEQVVDELVAAVSAKEGITFPPGTMERLAAYTKVVSTFPAAVKEFEWRNSYFYNLGDEACPKHNSLLRECESNGKLSFKLP